MHRMQKTFTLNLLSIAIGLIAGCTAWLFHILVIFTTSMLYGTTESNTFLLTIESLPAWYRILLPTAGGLFVGLLFRYIPIRDSGGEGVPEVMKAELASKSIIRPAIIPIKLLAATITLSSGGSAGREGPIVHVGSAIGSTIAQLTGRNQTDSRVLLAAGAEAGIAGMFAAPLSGIFFSIELILKKLTALNITVLFTAALSALFVAHYILGFNGFSLTLLQPLIFDPITFVLTIPFGFIAAVTALMFGLLLRYTTKCLHCTFIPTYIQPALGGLLVGIIGFFIPAVHEPATYATFGALLDVTSIPITILLLLLVAKICATSFTLGSGGVGGIFAPALLIGAVLGTLCGSLLVSVGLIPSTSIITFLLAGMAAVFAAVTHAPLTAIMVVYEITGDVMSIPFTTMATSVAYVIANAVNKYSVYTEHLKRG
jgi:CIC family chloride channel protein